MLDEYGFETYEENPFPLAYLLTFRTYGTWLHGDKRHSVGRNGRNIYGTPDIEPDENFEAAMREETKHPPVILNASQRIAVEEEIAKTCEKRGYFLHTVNARTNHVHAVVSAQVKPEIIINALKAYATRRLRKDGLMPRGLTVWSRGRSRKYLWKPRHVERAIDYVLYEQGDGPFEMED